MPVSIHNSLSRKKEELIPLRPPVVNMYTCGVTVYDESHIGHARSLYIFDVVRRYLKYRGFDVKFVRNITDIDDKIINRANELKTDWKELVSRYIDRYYEDLKELGIKKGDHEPRATDNIPGMIKYIEGLMAKGFAYATDSGVYFNVRKFTDYGKLSGQGIDQMQSGARIESDENKQDPLDFALWKISKPGEPSWESPWGAGRPGWHIECSVMSQEFLKTDTLDIHAGGRDLIFPHHENEIAQAEALTGKPFAKYWMHHGLLTINGQKMSKSLGNFVTIKDFLSKYDNADLLKLFFLSAHYSHPIDYNEEKIEEARKALERIMILLGKIDGEEAARLPVEVGDIRNNFISAMDDDFNTPQALASVFDLVNITNKNIDKPRFAVAAKNTLKELLGILGISLEMKQRSVMISDTEIEDKITQRNTARKNKDYSLSDNIRIELEEKGVILEDTKEGTVWRRKI
ncbi:MAG: cysteine--tRNA ligase [Candidatus Omnitrophota bacterium]|jgi:cysteinyl-tRNA synthetase